MLGNNLGTLGKPLGSSGNYLGIVGNHLGSSGNHLGLLGNYLGTLGKALGSSGSYLGMLGSNLGSSGNYLGTLDKNLGSSGNHLSSLGKNLGLLGKALGTLGTHLNSSGNHLGSKGKALFYFYGRNKTNRSMHSAAKTPDEYFDSLPADRQPAMKELRKVIKKNLPKGFKESMGYGMVGYAVPHSLYPAGYHCDPKLPLPFMGMASQKNFIAVYHMGIYSDPKLLDWFVKEYPKHSKTKLDMGKSCIRFKKPEEIPFKLIGELASKMTPEDWIEKYESAFKNSRKK